MDGEDLKDGTERDRRPGLHHAVRQNPYFDQGADICKHEHPELQIARSSVELPGASLKPYAGVGPMALLKHALRKGEEGDAARGELSRRADQWRVVDPRTGGMKNQKAVRPDLVPAEFAAAVDRYRDGDLLGRATEAMARFWFHKSNEDALANAAQDMVVAMGGAVAARKHLADLYGAGALKYSDDNWRKGYAWSLSYSAALRHLDAIERGEMVDKDSFRDMGIEVLHWACVWFHCAALWTFATKGLGTDDRPKPPTPTPLAPGQVIVKIPGRRAA